MINQSCLSSRPMIVTRSSVERPFHGAAHLLTPKPLKLLAERVGELGVSGTHFICVTQISSSAAESATASEM